MSEPRIFTLGHVLSITSGKLLIDLGGLYDILNHLTGENLFTHQLPRAVEVAKPFILGLYPRLELINTEGVGPENCQDRLAAWRMVYGDAFSLPTMPDGLYEPKHPVQEAMDMMGLDRVMIVTPDDKPEDIVAALTPWLD